MQFADLLDTLRKDVEGVIDAVSYQEVKARYFGKNGSITVLLKEIKNIPLESKKDYASSVNALKSSAEEIFSSKQQVLRHIELSKQLESESQDVTLPERRAFFGKLHPLTFVMEEITKIFLELGFVVKSGPEIEDAYHNFTALNIAENHPARDMHDTFYIKDIKKLLRTHTSSVQIRSLGEIKPPLKIVAPGSTYRADYDATHTPMFHQLEALYIDKNVSFANLKYCIDSFLSKFFCCDVKTRFRSSYFPFTEPSAEVDIAYKIENGRLEVGEGNKYLEVLGCGLVHPNVLKECKIDPNEYQGFALGMGIERLAMLKYGITDLREFFANDHRWTDHYGFQHNKS